MVRFDLTGAGWTVIALLLVDRADLMADWAQITAMSAGRIRRQKSPSQAVLLVGVPRLARAKALRLKMTPGSPTPSSMTPRRSQATTSREASISISISADRTDQ